MSINRVEDAITAALLEDTSLMRSALSDAYEAVRLAIQQCADTLNEPPSVVSSAVVSVLADLALLDDN